MIIATGFLEALGSFLVGLAGRLGLFLAAGFLLAAPALLLALMYRAIRHGHAPGELGPAGRVAPNHTWLEPWRRGALRVGVDEIAQRILPSATAVELPRPGMVVHRGDPIAVVRAGRRAVRIGAPVDGTIAAVNARVRRNPGLVKDAPYGEGWLFAIVPADQTWTKLPAGDEAEAFLGSESRRLARFIDQELGIAAADGGHLVAPAPALLGEDGWKRVVSAFLTAA